MTDYYSEDNSKAGWKEKILYYGKIILAIVVAIWIFSIANSASNLANQNADIINKPDYKIFHVAGGPERFSSEFDDALGDIDKSVADQYLWSSVIIENRGEIDGQEVKIDVKGAIPIKKIIVNSPGFYNDPEINHKEGERTATININEFDINGKATIFLGLLPAKYKDDLNDKKWVEEYQSYLEEVVIESDEAEARLYAPGYAALYK